MTNVGMADHTSHGACVVAYDDQQGFRTVERMRGADQSHRAIDRDEAVAGLFEEGLGVTMRLPARFCSRLHRGLAAWTYSGMLSV